MELILLLVVGLGGPVLGAAVSGRAVLRAAREQTRRERRVDLFTSLLPEVAPPLLKGRVTTGDARASVTRLFREATATGPEDRAHVAAALIHIDRADDAENRYHEAQQERQHSDSDEIRRRLSESEAERVDQIKQAGTRLQKYEDGLDRVLR
jgi:hypothetical protein